MPAINIWAALVAAVSCFFIGGLWYSPLLFLKPWMRASGVTGDPGQGHPAKVFGISFLFALAAAVVYAVLIPPPTDALHAAGQGLAVGLGLVATSVGINYQFANRNFIMLAIDGGYHTVKFVVYGLIIGLWR
jgi:hypothetical protein